MRVSIHFSADYAVCIWVLRTVSFIHCGYILDPTPGIFLHFFRRIVIGQPGDLDIREHVHMSLARNRSARLVVYMRCSWSEHQKEWLLAVHQALKTRKCFC